MIPPLSPRQSGYVLVTVLVLSLVASLVVFVSLRQNHLLERMSGNQQKTLNASLAASHGVSDAILYMKSVSFELTRITDANTGLVSQKGTPDNYSISNVFYSASDKKLTFLSKGQYQNAIAYLRTTFLLNSGSAGNATGVIGCNDIIINGGGFIDSYDSSKGGYDSNSNRANNAFVALVNGNSENVQGEPSRIPLGLSVINGDFTAYNGYVTTKGNGSIVSGNVVANGKVILNGNTTIGGNVSAKNEVTLNGNNTVGGAVHAGGEFIANSGTVVSGNVSANSVRMNGNTEISGSVTSNGELTMSGNNTTIGGNASASTADIKGTIKGSLSVDSSSISTDNGNGKALGGVTYNATSRAKNVAPTMPDPGELTNICQQNVASNTWLKNQLGTLPNSTSGELNNANFGSGLTNNAVYSKMSLAGESADNRKIITVLDNTVVYVTGEIVLTNLSIRIAKGKSLTFKQVTGGTGKVIDMNDVNITATDGTALGAASNNGVAPFSIYSDSTDKVNIRAENNETNNMYAAIYAPLARVTPRAGSGNLSGSILAKYVELVNDKGFHYDEGLGKSGSSGSGARLTLLSSSLYYPD